MMKRYLGIGAAWLGATVLSVFIASAAVAGIRDRVVETPVAIGPPTTSTTQAPADPTTSTVLEGPSTAATQSTTEPPPSTTEGPSSTRTTVVDQATTTTAPPVATTTSTTAPPQTTTTTAASYETHTLIGGTVTIGFGGGEVWIVALDPSAGFDADIEKDGPYEVEVDFESNTHKSELSAKFEDGELRVKKEEEPRDGEDD